MTIFTKPFTAKCSSEFANLPTAENGQNAETTDSSMGTSDKIYLIRARSRRLSAISTLLLFLSAVCVLCIGIIGGIAIYRSYMQSRMQRLRFQGMCGLPYENDFDAEAQMLQMLNEHFKQFAENIEDIEKTERFRDEWMDRPGIKDKFFNEEFDLDMDQNVAKINVPDFRDGRSGRFLHDFQNNQTAIIDQSAGRCFLMPLDRNTVLPPSSLADLIQKMYAGYYDIDTSAIRKKMRVITPEITDFSTVSNKIQLACDHLKAYRLEEFVGGVVKRSAELTKDGKFAEFTGHLVEYDLVNIDHVNEHERK